MLSSWKANPRSPWNRQRIPLAQHRVPGAGGGQSGRSGGGPAEHRAHCEQAERAPTDARAEEFRAFARETLRNAGRGIDPCHSLIGNLNQFSAAIKGSKTSFVSSPCSWITGRSCMTSSLTGSIRRSQSCRSSRSASLPKFAPHLLQETEHVFGKLNILGELSGKSMNVLQRGVSIRGVRELSTDEVRRLETEWNAVFTKLGVVQGQLKVATKGIGRANGVCLSFETAFSTAGHGPLIHAGQEACAF